MSEYEQRPLFTNMAQYGAQQDQSRNEREPRWYYVTDAVNERVLFMDDTAPGYRWEPVFWALSGPAIFNSYGEAHRIAQQFGGKVKVLPYDRYKLLRWWSGDGPGY